MKVGILTVSDRSSRKEREDLGGPLIKKIIENKGGQVIAYQIVPDEEKMIANRLIDLSDKQDLDLVITTGGTGFSPRDITPEATLKVIERRTPGLEEVMRMEGYKKNKKAVLSRGVCGIRGKTLIVNLPGSPKGIEEGLEILLPMLPHAVEVLRGEVKDCHDSQAKEEQ